MSLRSPTSTPIFSEIINNSRLCFVSHFTTFKAILHMHQISKALLPSGEYFTSPVPSFLQYFYAFSRTSVTFSSSMSIFAALLSSSIRSHEYLTLSRSCFVLWNRQSSNYWRLWFSTLIYFRMLTSSSKDYMFSSYSLENNYCRNLPGLNYDLLLQIYETEETHKSEACHMWTTLRLFICFLYHMKLERMF